ncbi:MAG: hypothetical protein Q4C64_08340 [Erysipelotrichia bacterium]|nr:hypothetical protein [Erysipelotrichia bacterium]
MTSEEGGQVYSLLWGEDSLYKGDLIPWDQFTELSRTKQQAYLDAIIQEDEEGMSELAEDRAKKRKEAYDDWAKTWEGIAANTFDEDGNHPIDENGNPLTAPDIMKQEEAHFQAWLKENGYTSDGLGGYVDGQGNKADLNGYGWLYSSTKKAFGGDIKALVTENSLGETLKNNANDAEAATKGYEMTGKSIDQTTEKLNRFKNALSGLPTELEDLKKLSKDLGISMSELINLDDLELAEKIFNKLKAPTVEDFTFDGIVDYAGYI